VVELASSLTSKNIVVEESVLLLWKDGIEADEPIDVNFLRTKTLLPRYERMSTTLSVML